MHSVVQWTPVLGVVALLFAWYKAGFVSRQDQGTDRMKEIASFISEGAMAFLRREYSVLAVFALFVAVALFLSNYSNGTQLVGVSYIVGASCSALAGFLPSLITQFTTFCRWEFGILLGHFIGLSLPGADSHSAR